MGGRLVRLRRFEVEVPRGEQSERRDRFLDVVEEREAFVVALRGVSEPRELDRRIEKERLLLGVDRLRCANGLRVRERIDVVEEVESQSEELSCLRRFAQLAAGV